MTFLEYLLGKCFEDKTLLNDDDALPQLVVGRLQEALLKNPPEGMTFDDGGLGLRLADGTIVSFGLETYPEVEGDTPSVGMAKRHKDGSVEPSHYQEITKGKL